MLDDIPLTSEELADTTTYTSYKKPTNPDSEQIEDILKQLSSPINKE